ncbi:GSCOCG00003521001-RA-CDS [Cotesia congregata]|nr:GSCOCG00003521001-RA-CDS [Cotesia congregata]
MGLTSDSETESVTMKSKIDEMDLEPIVANNDESIITKNKKTHDCTVPGCKKSFNKPSRLLWHLRKHTGTKPYKCNFEGCDKEYTNSSHLKRHQKVHETVHETVVCGICQLTLKNRTNLLKHHRRAHENKDRLSCKECGISFRKKYKYDEHMNRFHDGKLFKCNQCDREFKNLLKLKRHEKAHDVKYECTVENCKMIFDTYMEFRQHAKTHPKEHTCDKCNKKFLLKQELNKHLKTHEGKLLSCPYEDCHKTYALLNQLKVHIKAKHKNLKFECDLCKVTFPYKISLRKHIQRVHLNINVSKPKVYKKGEERKRRKDIGKQTRSMPSILAGVLLPPSVEKMVMNRETNIKLSDTNFESIEDDMIDNQV